MKRSELKEKKKKVKPAEMGKMERTVTDDRRGWRTGV